MMLHWQNMSNFRAINQPPDSPPKPSTREQPLHHAVFRQKCGTEQGQTLARPSVIVPLQEKQSRRQPLDEGDLGRPVSKAKRTSPKLKKKKRSSASSTSKPRRQQAAREKKVLTSIEKSPSIENDSSPPESSTEAADDSDFIPSPAALAEFNSSSASSTPSRRSPRKRLSRSPNAGLSPKAASALVVSKRENSPTLTPTATLRLVSPSRWNSPLRRKKIEKEGVAELPKEVYDYEKLKTELTVKEKLMIAAKERETGKFPEQRSVEETYEFEKKTKKRRPDKEVEQSQPRKRQKSRKSRKPRSEGHPVADESRTFNEEHHVSKQISTLRSPKGKSKMKEQEYERVEGKAQDSADITGVCNDAGVEAKDRSFKASNNLKAQRSFDTSAKSQGSLLHAIPSSQSRSQASNSRQQKQSLNEGYLEHFRRREISVPDTFQPCRCVLPEYFSRDPSRVPHLASWLERGGGGKLEFLVHVMQISSCRGSNHPKRVVDACRRILSENGYPEWWCNDPVEPVSKSAQGVTATQGTNDSNSRRGMRAQSSIAPWVFYGNKSGDRPTTDTGSSSRPILQYSKEVSNGCTRSETQPVRNQGQTATTQDCRLINQPSNSAVPIGPRVHLTSPNSSPLGRRRRTGTSSHHHQYDDSSTGQENVGVRPISKILPDVSSELDRPQISFNNQRHRHQSVPVDLRSRNAIAHERHPLPPSAPQRIDNALQEISDNIAIRDMGRKIDSIEQTLRQLLPAPALPRGTTVQSAQAPTAAPIATATAQGGGDDGAQQPPARRKRKRPSCAERQLKKPKLDRNVPPHLRLSDEQIIEVGRRADSYERHRGAPQAFNWSGHLYAEYKRLLGPGVNGVSAWTDDEIRRVTR